MSNLYDFLDEHRLELEIKRLMGGNFGITEVWFLEVQGVIIEIDDDTKDYIHVRVQGYSFEDCINELIDLISGREILTQCSKIQVPDKLSGGYGVIND